MSFIHEALREWKELAPSRRDLRNFGLVMLAALCLLGLIVWWKGGTSAPWLLTAGAAMGLCGLVRPAGLGIPYRIWMGFGLFMGATISRLILVVVFYLVVTPTGLAMRAMGKHPLDLRWDREAASYWNVRKPEPYDPERTAKMF